MATQLKQPFLLLILMVLVSPLFVHATDVKYCDKKGNYAVKIKNVEISPNPVVRGQPATFNLSASTGKSISGGKVVIDVNFFAIHVHTETLDLCEEVSCPIASGSFLLSHSQTLPSFTPPGSYTLKMTMTDTDGQKLTCVSFNFRISSGSSVLDE